MSKVDAQRAMKAARQTRSAAPASVRPAPGAAPGAAAAARPVAAPPAAVPAVPGGPVPVAVEPAAVGPAGTATATGTATCGHRSMAGKECRRPAGHPEKSHRYT